jgi:hypothetical protein
MMSQLPAELDVMRLVSTALMGPNHVQPHHHHRHMNSGKRTAARGGNQSLGAATGAATAAATNILEEDTFPTAAGGEWRRTREERFTLSGICLRRLRQGTAGCGFVCCCAVSTLHRG